MRASPQADPPITLVAYRDDPLARTAQRVLDRFAGSLPRLDHLVILVSEPQAVPRLRAELLRLAEARGTTALLGPQINTLPGWIRALGLPDTPQRAAAGRELMLTEALEDHPGLFGDVDPWRLADSLLELFDELTLHECRLPDQLPEFVERLQRGYDMAGAPPTSLDREAALIHTLWRAWHEQLAAERCIDPNAAYLLGLHQSLRQLSPETFFVLVGFEHLRPAERGWVEAVLAAGQAELVLHGQTGGGDPDRPVTELLQGLAPAAGGAQDVETLAAARFFDAVFQSEGAALGRRAAQFAQDLPRSPIAEHMGVLAADNAEQEAHAVDLQVRRWLLQGHERIGIVTEDRRLARRVRALLERAGVALQDTGGWTLSTTSAATVIERWLEAVEEDFAHQPLLDLLKSPFMVADESPDGDRAAVYRFEQDIVLHENIGRGLARYRAHLAYRRERLGWSSATTERVEALLERLDRAAQPLAALRDGRRRDPATFLDALHSSLETLGAWPRLAGDPAGYRILEQLEHMRVGLRHRRLRLDWPSFRNWLARTLEKAHFQPVTAGSPVQLLNLAQSRLGRFDGLVIAGAEAHHLPGRDRPSPYFNDRVRRELGLVVWEERRRLRLHHFRRLLEAAPRVLITHRREQDGEPVPPSPWVQLVQSFHRLAYAADLAAEELAALVRHPGTQVLTPDPAPLPALTHSPRPRTDPRRIPQTVTAGAHQRLIDCPYQFFAADCLGLQPRDEVREVLEKSDYGNRVHRCLEAFHGNVPGLPGPFTEPVTADNRHRAIALLERIAREQFARDLEDNFQHRGWLTRWLELIPAYVDWQLERQRHWKVQEVEQAAEACLSDPWRLKGRVDRLDRGERGGLGLIDYKTGAVPTPREVSQGEAVQLPTYALLVPGTQRVEYVEISRGVRSAAPLEGEELAALTAAVGQRLSETLDAAARGTPLPAWGDPQTCSHCSISGVCRRQAWANDPAASDLDPDANPAP